MFSRVRIAIRFFFLGLAVGVLLAPRSGQETRRLVRERADRLLNDLLDAATLGALDTGTGNVAQEVADQETGATEGGNGSRTARSGNGRAGRRESSTAQAQA
ncbi:MAG TPA: YtxH domain-containing protein [candidate division Zixibacteria bacterium]|nr:YtxH domain-containing protein [candidate division Zixibacteria bacterium]